MNKLLNKRREIIVIVLYVAVIVGIFYLTVFPLIKKIEERNNKIQENTIKKESADKHLEELPVIEEQYLKIKEEESAIEVLLDRNNAVVLIEKLEKLAEETNNKITISIVEKVDQQKAPVKGKAVVDNSIVATLASSNYLQMKISLIGEYNTIMKFVKLLENFEYYSDVVAIQIVQDDSEGNVVRQNSGNIGMLANPFEENAVKTNEAGEEVKSGGKKLKASLDTVFYLK